MKKEILEALEPGHAVTIGSSVITHSMMNDIGDLQEQSYGKELLDGLRSVIRGLVVAENIPDPDTRIRYLRPLVEVEWIIDHLVNAED
jgi:hypothetical protein